MNQLEYIPGIGGASIQLDGPVAFVGTAENLRGREWNFDLGYRDLVSANRPARTVDVTLWTDPDTANALRRVADADVMAKTPGTLIAQGEWKQSCYILEAKPAAIHYDALQIELKVALLDGAWWRMVEKEFLPEETPVTEYSSDTGEIVNVSGAVETPLHSLKIYGKSVQDGTPTPSSPVPIEVVDGINMMKPPTNANTSNGVTFTPDNSGHIALANTATGAAYCDYYTTSSLLALEPGTYTVKAYGLKTGITIGFGDYYGGSSHYAFELTPVAPEHTLTISENKTYTAYIKVTSGTSTGVDVYVQLEKGSTATPYIPYGSLGLKVNSTITPIDLQGNVLASLPDGTKDELTVDSAGHKVIKKRVVYLVYDGSEDESWAYESAAQGNFYIATVNDGTKANSYGNMMMCNYATPTAGTSTTKDHVRISSGASHYLNVALGNSLGINTAAGFKTWLATHNLIVLAPLETEQTIDLGYIDPPAIPDGAAISITAQVTPTITASWWARGAAAIASFFLDYPHNYEYDYSEIAAADSIESSVFTPSDVHLVIFGPATNPYILVGGNKYQVNVTVPSGGYVTVDGREKTIVLTLADGTEQNAFSYGVRGGGQGGGTYVFEPIQAGAQEVTYSGAFGFNLGWYEEEGEPPWKSY